MFETPSEIEELQALIDRSFAGAGPHLLSVMEPERRLSARQVVAYLQGMKHLALATVSSKGLPYVAPVDAHFLNGHFYFSTAGNAFRARHLRRNPELSATHFAGDDLAIDLHGRAVFLERGSEEARRLDQYLTELYGQSPYTMADVIVLIRIEARFMVTFAMHPENYPAA